MAFPDDHRWKAPLTIASSEVSSTLTNFPVLLTAANLPSAMFDADGANPAQNGGGDIRFSSDADGATQLPCEVVSFVTDNNPANGTAEIHVKVPSVSSSVDTTVYVWWNTAGTDSQPAIDSTYGAENVWDSAFVGVWHLEEDPSGTAPQMLDSTSNDHDGTSAGTMTTGDSVAAVVGNGLDFDGTDDGVSIAETAAIDITGALTLEMALNGDTFGAFVTPATKAKASGQKQFMMDLQSGVPRFGDELGLAKATSTLSTGTDYHLAGTYSGSGLYSGLKIYLNGVAESTTHVGTFNGIESTDGDFYIGQKGDGSEWFDGKISEVRLSNVARSAAWIAATDSTLLTPGTFASAGTPERLYRQNGAALLMQMIGM